MPNTPDTESTVINYQAKIPKTGSQPNEDIESYFTSTIYNNDLTHKINATESVGVDVPTTQGKPRSIDPLMSLKARQHHISFANNYLVDSVQTTTTPPIKHIIKLVSLAKDLDAKHAVINSITPTPPKTIPFAGEIKNIPNSIDAQPFDELPNGAEFNFIITETNTLEEIDVVYEFKHLTYNDTTDAQESETKTFTYPLKNTLGNSDVEIGVLKQGSYATIIFDKTLNVWKLMSVSNSTVSNTQKYLYQCTFTTNEYTLTQSSNYLLPKNIENGFTAQFIAPANNTGSVTVKIQKYDGTYHTTLTAKKYSGINLVNLVADDIKQNQLYTLVIISGELVVFGIQPQQTQQRIELSYNSPTSLNYSAGGFVFDDFSGSGVISAGTLNLTGLTANASWYIFAIANPTTGEAQIQHYNSLTPTLPTGFTKKKLLFAFITNANSQLRAMKIHNLPNAYKVEYLTNIQEYLNYAVQTAGELKTFTVPGGVEVEIQGSYRKDTHGANNIGIGFTHPSKTSLANDGSFFSYTGVANSSYDFGASFKTFTDTNRQVRISATALTGLSIIYTWGYTIYL